MTSLTKPLLTRILIAVALIVSIGVLFTTTGCIRSVEDFAPEDGLGILSGENNDENADSNKDSDNKERSDDNDEDEDD